MNRVSLLNKLKTMNWRNTLFRLWIALTIFWELFVVFTLITEDFRISILFALIWPFALLVIFIAIVKLGVWVFAGLEDKGGKIESLIKKIDSFLTIENCVRRMSRISKVRRNKKICLMLGALGMLAGVIIFLKLSSDPWAPFPDANTVSPFSHNELPPPPPGFVLDKTKGPKAP